MSCSAEELSATFARFPPGLARASASRYLHPLEPVPFMHSAGVQQMLLVTQADWLVEFIARKYAPVFHQAWMQGKANDALVELVVERPEAGEPVAHLSLTLNDELQHECTPRSAALQDEIFETTFPAGTWQFVLDTQDEGEALHVTHLMLATEH
ncbi:hypothetical protein BH09PSE6_BH09PSE6_24100 [soil metagenome]